MTNLDHKGQTTVNDTLQKDWWRSDSRWVECVLQGDKCIIEKLYARVWNRYASKWDDALVEISKLPHGS